MGGEERVGVYVSVPFCRHKCSFCNFASGVGKGAELEAYVGRLCEEITAVETIAERVGGVLPQVVDTVYFGGGTPSLMSAEQWRRVMGALRGVFDIAGDAEVTMEAAPGQIADDVLEEVMRSGVNRVSLGVQSFVDRECAAVGRVHTGASCLAEIARLRAAGLGEVAVDLIAGLPYQTEASWAESLRMLVDSGATHASVYMLEVDEESRLGREVMAGGVRFHAHAVPEEERNAALYEQACEWLEGRGFPLYEISNFATREHESRHNRKYWERKPYIGFGMDAHSMLMAQGTGNREQRTGAAVRFANVDTLSAYGEMTWGESLVLVGENEAFEESVFLGFRLREGVAVAGLREEFGPVRVDAVAGEVREMVSGGLMVEEDGRWKLTGRGRVVSSEVFGRLLAGT